MIPSREDRRIMGVNPPEKDLECPICHKMIWSDFADNRDGLAVHVRFHHGGVAA